MYTLRPYQVEASNQAVKNLKTYNQPFIIMMAAGAGKSLVIADICHKIDEPILILQPSKELLEQNFAKLKSYGVEDVAIYSASKNSRDIGKYTYATIGSIYRKPELFQKFKYVIIDECHLVDPSKTNTMYKKFFNAMGNPSICGLTATPYRVQQKYIMEGEELRYTAIIKMITRIWNK